MDDPDETQERRRLDRAIYRILRSEVCARAQDETAPASDVGPRGPREQQYLDQLGVYAFAVLKDMVASGRIFAIVRDRGWPVEQRGPLGDDVDEFVRGWLALGWDSFVTAIRKDRWDAGRSSLPSYFVTLCIGRFGRFYRSWWDERASSIAFRPDVDDVPVEDHRSLDDFDSGLDARERELIKRIVLTGQPAAEAARDMGLSEHVARRAYRDAIAKLRRGQDDHEEGS